MTTLNGFQIAATASHARFLAAEFIDLLENTRLRAVTPSVSLTDIRARLSPYTFDAALPLADTLVDVADLLKRGTLHASHPRYFGLFVPGVHEAGVWGDALAAMYNPQLAARWHAPAACEIERHTLAYLASLIGYEATAAHFTSGASEANLTALVAAVAAAYPDAPSKGVACASNARVYASSEVHHSVHKAMRVVGLGTDTLCVVPCNASYQMDVSMLRTMIAADRSLGRRPIAVIGTVGTTSAGAIDDLSQIAEIAEKCGAWFHVDAAWGGAAGFIPDLQPLLSGISRADSVTWDAHKTLSVPMGAGMFFSKRPEVLRAVFEVQAAYVPEEPGGDSDPYLTSLQWSRRFIGLKVFLTLASQGRREIADRLQRQCHTATHLRGRLTQCGWKLMNSSPFPVVCATHPALSEPGAVGRVCARVVRSGQAWLSTTTLRGVPVVRACVTHDDCSVADADALIQELVAALNVTVA